MIAERQTLNVKDVPASSFIWLSPTVMFDRVLTPIGDTMKTIIATLLTLFSLTANAAMWELIQVENSGGMYFCVYRLQGTNLTQVLQSRTYCQSYIFK